MSAAEESVVAVRQLHGEFTVDPVGGGWINLTGLEALAEMVGKHIAPSLTTPSDRGILILRE
jgi:hypothetical protein